MRTVLLVVLVFLSGCAGTTLKSSERWVEINTLYSTNSPSIELKVSPYLNFEGSKEKAAIAESSENSLYYAGVDSEVYRFAGGKEKKSKALYIQFDVLDSSSRHSIKKPDYVSSSTFFMSSDPKVVGGISFDTAILRKIIGGPMLVKAFGTVIGDKTKFQIMYMERVDSSWAEKLPDTLTNDDLEFVSEFSQRADESFSIAPYSGKPIPQ